MARVTGDRAYVAFLVILALVTYLLFDDMTSVEPVNPALVRQQMELPPKEVRR